MLCVVWPHIKLLSGVDAAQTPDPSLNGSLTVQRARRRCTRDAARTSAKASTPLLPRAKEAPLGSSPGRMPAVLQTTKKAIAVAIGRTRVRRPRPTAAWTWMILPALNCGIARARRTTRPRGSARTLLRFLAKSLAPSPRALAACSSASSSRPSWFPSSSSSSSCGAAAAATSRPPSWSRRRSPLSKPAGPTRQGVPTSVPWRHVGHPHVRAGGVKRIWENFSNRSAHVRCATSRGE
mmetsp:Transcript_39776/g.90678  ORF Transcript_39776/g.90678 Transcript_39776/m.90678 type:complete len:237 (-) Transcript_39776:30-740(-)